MDSRKKAVHLPGWVWTLVLALALLGACGRTEDAALREIQTIPLDAFPQTVGRGFPQAVWVDTTAEPAVGQPAPDFAFALADNRGATLSALQGHPVVINFWATWCGPCRREMPEFVALSREDPEVVVLAVNVEEERSLVVPFAQEFQMPFPVILDPEGVIRRHYGVRGLPTTFFVGPDGRIKARWNGLLTGEMLHQLLEEARSS